MDRRLLPLALALVCLASCEQRTEIKNHGPRPDRTEEKETTIINRGTAPRTDRNVNE